MDYLLDTHVLLWGLHDPARLSDSTKERLDDPDSNVFVSIVSLWEIVLKNRLGKLEVDVEDLFAILSHTTSKIRIIGISLQHLLTFSTLPRIQDHNDPFDHLLISQALSDGMMMVSIDRRFASYAQLKLLSDI